MDRGRIIDGLNALYESMHKNQCYACSYEFIETVKEFGTEILAEAEEYIKNQPHVVRCKDCNNACICSDDWVICTHIDSNGNDKHPVDWFCADGEKRTDLNDTINSCDKCD